MHSIYTRKCSEENPITPNERKTMIQVKIFEASSIVRIQSEINEWIYENREEKVKDIRFTNDGNFYAAFIIYEELIQEDKKSEILFGKGFNLNEPSLKISVKYDWIISELEKRLGKCPENVRKILCDLDLEQEKN